MGSAQGQARISEFRKPVQAVEVVAMEMLTPIGANAEQTATSVRAGISAYQASSTLNKQLNPMTMALVPEEALTGLNDKLTKLPLTSRQRRMLQLAASPLQLLFESFPLQSPVPLVLACPEKLPGRRSVVSDKFLSQLQLQADVILDLDNSYVFPHGRAAGLHALEAAMQMIEQGISQYVIVGAVDSYHDLELLGILDKEDRVLAEGVMNGFAPAEGAAFMLIQAATENSNVRVYPPGIAKETGHRYSDAPYRGEGLAEAVSDALSQLPDKQIRTVMAGFTGENFSAKEWGVSAIRNSGKIDNEHMMVHPADCFGDTGASLGLILIQLGIIGLSKGYYKGPVLAWCSSELAQRAAVTIDKQEE